MKNTHFTLDYALNTSIERYNKSTSVSNDGLRQQLFTPFTTDELHSDEVRTSVTELFKHVSRHAYDESHGKEANPDETNRYVTQLSRYYLDKVNLQVLRKEFGISARNLQSFSQEIGIGFLGYLFSFLTNDREISRNDLQAIHTARRNLLK